MYRIIIHKKVIRFLQTRSISEQRLIRSKIDLLKFDPYKNNNLDIKKLKGVDSLYRLRIGKIRLIYQVLENELILLIITAGSRGNIYKNL